LGLAIELGGNDDEYDDEYYDENDKKIKSNIIEFLKSKGGQ